jgi:hypothetical protein
MKSGDSVVLGRSPNATNTVANSGSNETDVAKEVSGRGVTNDVAVERKKKQDETARARRDEQKKKSDKKETGKKERAADDARGQSRPRRVG